MTKQFEPTVLVTKRVIDKVDNFALQVTLRMLEKAKLNNNDMLEVYLGSCTHCSKQRIVITETEDNMLDEDFEDEKCIYCEAPVDEILLAYMCKEDELLICLKSEAMALSAEL